MEAAKPEKAVADEARELKEENRRLKRELQAAQEALEDERDRTEKESVLAVGLEMKLARTRLRLSAAEQEARDLAEELARLRAEAGLSESEVLAAARAELADKASRLRKAEELAGRYRAALRKIARLAALDSTNSGIPSSAGSFLELPRDVWETLSEALGTTLPKADPKGNTKKNTEYPHNRNQRRASAEDGGGEKRKPGGQPGRKGACRREIREEEADEWHVHMHEERPEGCEGDEWRPTEEHRLKQVVEVRTSVVVHNHYYRVWTDGKGGRRIGAPEEHKDEVSYGDSVRAMAMMIKNEGVVAQRVVAEILRQLAGGVLRPSSGWIAGLDALYARKSKDRREEAVRAMSAGGPDTVAGVDCTVAKVNGRRGSVTVTWTSDGGRHYAFTERKGHEAAGQSPCHPDTGYAGSVVSDREQAFSSFGENGRHQFCLTHMMRACTRAIDLEGCPWAAGCRRMLASAQKASTEARAEARRTGRAPVISREAADRVRGEYDAALAEALRWRGQLTEEERASAPDSLRLLEALETRKDHFLAFLDNPALPADNSESERMAATYKRVLRTIRIHRSHAGARDRCAYMSDVETGKARGVSAYDTIRSVFGGGKETQKEKRDPAGRTARGASRIP